MENGVSRCLKLYFYPKQLAGTDSLEKLKCLDLLFGIKLVAFAFTDEILNRQATASSFSHFNAHS